MQNAELTINNIGSQALLKHVALSDLLDGWKDGILTIGTIGYDPLKSLDQNKFFALESEDELDEDDRENILVEGDDEMNYNSKHEELNPLMHTTFEHNFDDFVSSDHNASKEEMVINFNGVVVTPPVILHEAMESNGVETERKKKNGERITLVDLFFVDSDVNLKLEPAKALLQLSGKPSLKANYGFSFTKKLIPRVKDNPHLIKDIKKLMKKMLKRKIHPKFDVDDHKLEGQKASEARISDNHKHEANNTTSLLPI